MPKLKVQFHIHTAKDPLDRPRHTEKQMIDFAAVHRYDAVSITCHNSLVFNKNLKKYAAEKNILLIPGIEKSVEGKHVLIINATQDTEKIQTFDDLQTYKKQYPDCLVIAPHPYYFAWFCLHKKLDQHIKLFDAIEYSWYHTKRFNTWNQKAQVIAKKYNLPLIATSDNHILRYFDIAYSYIDTTEKSWPAICKAIKNHKIEMCTNPLPEKKFFAITGHMLLEFDIKNRIHRGIQKLKKILSFK